MSQDATLQLVYDGLSNVLQIRRGTVAGVRNIVVDCCRKDLPRSYEGLNVDCLNRLKKRASTVAQSTDFVCMYGKHCGYSHKLESKYILHARSHFVFEVAPDAVHDTVFKYSKGKYTCSKCPRLTSDWISFREHIRHHILELPYKCSKCMALFSSVLALRIHFQRLHVGQETDFMFNCSVDDFSILLTMLLPEAPAVRLPFDISFMVPFDTKTRISCMSLSAENYPVRLVRQLTLTDDQCLDQQQELSASDSSFPDDSCILKVVPGRYEYNHGTYKCVACCYRTSKEAAFSCHAWKHIHGSWRSTCAHNATGLAKLSSECAVVNGLIKMLKRVALNQATTNILRKTPMCGTKSQARSQAYEAQETVSSVTSTAKSKFDFMEL